MKVVLGISNRHVHLNKENLEKLFGSEYELKNVKLLNQPNQFISDSKVSIKTSNGIIDNVTVVGDLREYTQIEISATDAKILGINPPIRESGNLHDRAIVTLVGPKGEVTTNGCIIADRHIHITPKQKELYKLNTKEEFITIIEEYMENILKNML